jgi:hypothetical protein
MSGAVGTALEGGTLVATAKSVWVAGIVVAAGLAFVGGGATGGLGLFPSASPEAGARASGAAPRDPAPASRSGATGDASLAANPEAEPEPVRRLRDENARLAARVAELERETAAARAAAARPAPEKGPVFTFGEMGRLDAVREADWPALAEAAKVVADSVAEIHRAAREGRTVAKEVHLRLQENVERVRTYEYRTVDRMPTAAQHNGELTHPISATNLLAHLLAQAGKPLTPGQVAEFDRLGLGFEAEFAAVRAGWGPDVPRARRLLQEMRVKGRFMDALWATLTEDQRPLWVDPALRGVASVDLFDPTLMVIHTSPLVTGAAVADLKPRLFGLLRPKVGLSEGASDPRLEAAVDAFLARTTRGLEPVPRTLARNYTFAHAMLAGEATADLVDGLLRDFDLSPEARKALLEDPSWYVPRLVSP